MASRRKRRKVRKRRRSRGTARIRWFLVVVVVGLISTAGYFLYPYWQLSGRLDNLHAEQPSRLYGGPRLLRVGEGLVLGDLAEELELEGYRSMAVGSPVWSGSYARDEGGIRIGLRPHPTREGRAPASELIVTVIDGKVATLELDGIGLRRVELEPPLIASFYDDRLVERRPLSLAEIPEESVLAVLAAEDSHFFEHSGLSVSGILRAAWANARDGGILQGGSTLTQQFVKNEFLTPERTWNRKARELVLALLLEARYDKRTILRAYLNSIYWGRSGSVQLIGLGAAAWGYFGKPASSLTLSESAVLAGIISSPGSFSPLRHPEKALERRDYVLGRLEALGWVSGDRVAAAREHSLGVAARRLVARRTPHFADAMVVEARQRFGITKLANQGIVLLSTLDIRDQLVAEEAVRDGLGALRESHDAETLEVALVSVDPRDGGILAYVGGRDYGKSQFDRVANARRQTGSAFKPVVYAAAFASGQAAPSTLLEDASLTVGQGGRSWTPRNSDGKFRGWVTARRALEESLNVPTVRVGLQVGLDQVIAMARRMGIETRLQPVPSLVLGAFEVRPIQLVSVYATLAAGGRRAPTHGLSAALDSRGSVIEDSAPGAVENALSPAVAYLVTSALQGVFDRGTARSARRQGIRELLAGKTGTTNDRRDSWFAGYSSDRATLVWVGRDDNSSMRLTGATGALPIWTRFTVATRPPGGYPAFARPPGLVDVMIDPRSGQLATNRCPEKIQELFVEEREPVLQCGLHGGKAIRPRGKVKSWIDKVLGRERSGS